MFSDKNLVGHSNVTFKIIPLALIFFSGNLVLFSIWKPEIQQERGENTKDLKVSCINTGSFRNTNLTNVSSSVMLA